MKRKHSAAIRQQPKNLKVSSGSEAGDVEEDRSLLKDDVVEELVFDDDLPCETVSTLMRSMSDDNLVMFFNLVGNISDLLDALNLMGLYDDVDDDYDVLHGNNDETIAAVGECSLIEDESINSADAVDSLVDVTEDDLIQLAAETEQDDGEKEDLIEGLRTLRFGSQEEVVISLKSKFMEMNDKKEDILESDEDIDAESNKDDLVLSPKKSKTCPASSFKNVLKNKSALEKSNLGSERPRAESTTGQESHVSTSKPKKSRSMPDIVDEKKSFASARKIFEKQSSCSQIAPKPKAPWLPSGRRILPKPEKFFSPSSPKPSTDAPSKGLRQRVLTRAAEINKKPTPTEKKSSSKTAKRPRAVSKTIEEKSKIFSNEPRYGVVYSRPADSSNSTKRPPWRYGKSKAPSVALPTIKPFIMRKATRKHELGLNREQLKDLQSGLSKVLDHTHQSCPSTPARFASLASSPLGRIPFSASRAASATFASSNSPQTEYHGCEVCRLKEAMRNSPVSHKLKNAPHRCSSQTNITRLSTVPESKPKVAKKQQSIPRTHSTAASLKKEVAPASKKKKDFSSPVLPGAVSTLLFVLLLISFILFFHTSINTFLLYHIGLATAVRFSYHCYQINMNTVNNPSAVKSGSFTEHLHVQATTTWTRLSKISWKNAVSQCHFFPRNSAVATTVLARMLEDGLSLSNFVYNQYSRFASHCLDNLPFLTQMQRRLGLFLLAGIALYFAPYYPLPFVTAFVSAAFVPSIFVLFRPLQTSD